MFLMSGALIVGCSCPCFVVLYDWQLYVLHYKLLSLYVILCVNIQCQLYFGGSKYAGTYLSYLQDDC